VIRPYCSYRNTFYRVSLVALCLCALTSCQQFIPSIIVNDSKADVVVRYVMHRWEIAPGRLMNCPFVSDPIRGASTVVSARNWRDAQWEKVEDGRFNPDTCEAELVVKAGSSLWIETNGTCDDYEKYQKRIPGFLPTLDVFVVTSPVGKVELHGWDVARAFESRWGGACIFEVSRAMKGVGRS